MFVTAAHVIRYKVNESKGVRSMVELKIYASTTSFLFKSCAFLLSIMFQNQLFQEKKSSLMINSLSNLNLWLPQMWSICFFAFITLQIRNHKFNDKCLLQISAIHNFFLNCNFNFKPSRMWLCPNETCIDHFNSL